MFFNKPREEEREFVVDDAMLEAKIDPYAKLKQFYFKDIDGQKLVLNVSNKLKQSNAIMQFDDGTMWKCSYLGVVFEFLNSTIQQINASPHLSSSVKNWVEGVVPVNLNPQIEISPHKIVSYVLQAVRKYPTNEYHMHIEELENFKIMFDACELTQSSSEATSQ